jgi:hypothetical protein
MIVVGVCAAGLSLWGLPTSVITFFTVLGATILTALRLARHGFKLVDIATLLAIILLTAAIVLSAMDRTRTGTIGKGFFPSGVPARYMPLFSNSE